MTRHYVDERLKCQQEIESDLNAEGIMTGEVNVKLTENIIQIESDLNAEGIMTVARDGPQPAVAQE